MKILARAHGLNKLVFREVQARLWIGGEIARENRGEPLHVCEGQGKFKPPGQVARRSGMTAHTVSDPIDEVAAACHLIRDLWWQASDIESCGCQAQAEFHHRWFSDGLHCR